MSKRFEKVNDDDAQTLRVELLQDVDDVNIVINGHLVAWFDSRTASLQLASLADEIPGLTRDEENTQYIAVRR